MRTAVWARPQDEDFNAHLRSLDSRLRQLCDDLEHGRLSVERWQDEMHEALLQGHTDAAKLGYQLSGSDVPDEAELRLIGRSVVDGESDYLNKWAAQLKRQDGRYLTDDGDISGQAMYSRARLYALKTRGTANEAFVDGSPNAAKYDWELGGCEHCPDCPELASLSPYTSDTLIGFPGDGGTPCLSNCCCSLVRDDGVRGFSGRGALAPD